MSRAEQAAMKAYPEDWQAGYFDDPDEVRDDNEEAREYFQQGYGQAEKDLALTADDVKNIFNKVRDKQVKYCATEGCYQEVADWFNKQRNDTRE